jgi:hypothetical protein
MWVNHRHTGTRNREQSGGRRLKVRQRRSKAWPPPASVYGAVFVEVGVGTELGQIRVHQGMGAPLATSLSRSRSR